MNWMICVIGQVLWKADVETGRSTKGLLENSFCEREREEVVLDRGSRQTAMQD